MPSAVKITEEYCLSAIKNIKKGCPRITRRAMPSAGKPSAVKKYTKKKGHEGSMENEKCRIRAKWVKAVNVVNTEEANQ
jgi:hypothetical protein